MPKTLVQEVGDVLKEFWCTARRHTDIELYHSLFDNIIVSRVWNEI